MVTRLVKSDGSKDDKVLIDAAFLLKKSELVAFPTETVYGLGANALDEQAVIKIFEAKGRPSDNPLIVHISDRHQLDELVLQIPEAAEKLIQAFWPGALTLVFKKNPVIPDIITGGLNTVAIRMPVHPVAIELIRLAGFPLAAPSANRSGKPSPTAAAHVLEDMDGRIPMIIDGGSCEVGIESTVLDMTVFPPMLLRPGGVTSEMIEAVIGKIQLDPALGLSIDQKPSATASTATGMTNSTAADSTAGVNAGTNTGSNRGTNTGKNTSATAIITDKHNIVPKAPGMKYTHYAPEAPMTLFVGDAEAVVQKVTEMIALQYDGEKRMGIICTDESMEVYN